MLFNSIDFALFLPIVLFLYWVVFRRNLGLQNLFLVVASYTFYGWWDYRFLALILFSTLVDYFVGILLSKEENRSRRKALLGVSLAVNLGLLGFFKYYNFFLDNFVSAFSFFGFSFSANSLNIVLPVGISFYTFQTLSYSIDVYRGRLQPTRDFIAFAGFVCFFPQLVAGPIERAINLLPQFFKQREIVVPFFKKGAHLILWGLFKKVVVADNCAEYANLIFNDYNNYSAGALFLGALFFTFQIYGDFSGYSDIAIGTAHLFGFRLSRNFALPYFSRDIAEFWRRWHISLSTWFRDYLYIPLGGSRVSTSKKVRNIFIVFLVSGFWHGANWTFLFWGGLNALFFLPLLLRKKNRQHLNVIAHNRSFPSLRELIQVIFTFMLTVFAWIFFRSKNLSEAFEYIGSIITLKIHGGGLPMFGVHLYNYLGIAVSVLFLLLVEFYFERKEKPFRYWAIILIFVLFFGVFKDTNEFIYFQF